MNDTLSKVYEDTDTLLGFVSFLKEMGINNLNTPAITKAAQFYASYKEEIEDPEQHNYSLALGRFTLCEAPAKQGKRELLAF